MEALLSWYHQFLELSKINPVMSGLVGVWMAAVTTYLFRNVPMRMWHWLTRQSTRHLQLTSVGPDGPNKSYNLFLDWFSAEKKRSRFVRSWQLSTARSGGSWQNRISAGYSRHYFFYKWRLFWFTKRQLDSQGTENIKEQLDITVLFGTQTFLLSFINEFKYSPPASAERMPDIYTYWRRDSFSYWDNIAKLSPRNLNTVAIRKSVREEIVRKIELFESRRDWYLTRGIPYKLTFEFTGPSGTGKTSLVRALATYFKRDLYIIRLNELADRDLQIALSKVPSGAFILLEDYDSCEALLDRKKLEQRIRADAGSEADAKFAMSVSSARSSVPTLSGVLNAFDGVIALNGQIVFWTTNHPEIIDAAVRRAGRMDYPYELGDLHHEDIVEFVNGIYPEAVFKEHHAFDRITGAKLSSLLLEHAEELQLFVDSIPSESIYRNPIKREFAPEIVHHGPRVLMAVNENAAP